MASIRERYRANNVRFIIIALFIITQFTILTIFKDELNNDLPLAMFVITLLVAFYMIVLEVALYYVRHQPLYCKYCLKTILLRDIVPFKCPFCKTVNKSRVSLYTTCREKSCRSIIPAIPCPHCKKSINLLEDYDMDKIKTKRYGKKI